MEIHRPVLEAQAIDAGENRSAALNIRSNSYGQNPKRHAGVITTLFFFPFFAAKQKRTVV